MRWSGVIVMLAGCHRVFGLDDVGDGSGDGGALLEPMASDAACKFGEWSSPQALSIDVGGVDERQPALSIDGTKLAYTRGGVGLGEVYIATRSGNDFIEGKPATGVNEVGTNTSGPFWGAIDPTALYFTRGSPGGPKYKAELDRSSPVPATEFDLFGYLERPQFSASGLELVYSAETPTAHLFIATRPSSGSNVWAKQRVDELASNDVDDGPSWTADRSTIIFSSRRSDGTTRKLYSAYRSFKETMYGSVQEIPVSTASPQEVALSRDGTTLVFTGYLNGATSDLLIMTRSCL